MQIVAYNIKVLIMQLIAYGFYTKSRSLSGEEVMIFNILLVLHIIAGGVALVAAIGASAVKQCNWSHQWHRRFGQYFFYSMLIIFLTAIPMSIINSNVFLFFIALFSFYFAHAGWRYARNRTGVATTEDWVSVGIMAIVCLGMLIYGLLLSHNYSENIVLIVFSGIGLFNAVRDGYSLHQAQTGRQATFSFACVYDAGGVNCNSNSFCGY